MAASNLKGRWVISRYIVENFPHVHGKRFKVMLTCINGKGNTNDVVYRNEKFCISLNLLGCLGVGIMDRGEVW